MDSAAEAKVEVEGIVAWLQATRERRARFRVFLNAAFPPPEELSSSRAPVAKRLNDSLRPLLQALAVAAARRDYAATLARQG